MEAEEIVIINGSQQALDLIGKLFLDESEDNTMRLNYSMSDDRRMEDGMKRLAAAIGRLL